MMLPGAISVRVSISEDRQLELKRSILLYLSAVAQIYVTSGMAAAACGLDEAAKGRVTAEYADIAGRLVKGLCLGFESINEATAVCRRLERWAESARDWPERWGREYVMTVAGAGTMREADTLYGGIKRFMTLAEGDVGAAVKAAAAKATDNLAELESAIKATSKAVLDGFFGQVRSKMLDEALPAVWSSPCTEDELLEIGREFEFMTSGYAAARAEGLDAEKACDAAVAGLLEFRGRKKEAGNGEREG